MKVVNLIWGFTPGGVGKCFLTYSGLGCIDSRIDVRSVCINLRNTNVDTCILKDQNVCILEIENRLDFSWIKQVNVLIKRERPDLIFTHGFNGPIVVLLCRLFGGKNIPLVCSYHGEYHPPTRSRKLLAPIFNGTIHFIYRYFAHAVLGVSNFNLDLLRDCHVPEHKLSYVYNGVSDISGVLPEPEGFPRLGPETVKFLVASRIDAIKGLDALIDGFSAAKKTGRDIALIIVGNGPLRCCLEQKVEKLGLADSVRIVGYKEDVAAWMAYCDVFCLPSFVESFSLSLIEALRAGLPSIVSDAGGIPEAVSRNEALFVRAGDVNSITSCIEIMSDDESLRMRLGNAARRRFLDNFTEKKMMRGVADWLLKCGGCNA